VIRSIASSPLACRSHLIELTTGRAQRRLFNAAAVTAPPESLWVQCAGGFALEGRGGLLVERIEGCFSNVIGLSLPLLRRWLSSPAGC
jgi:septum formation protein